MNPQITYGGLPDCQLLRVLDRKAREREDIGFDFFARLRDLRDRVSREVCHINELFPEFTPHDEQYHLLGLFYVADVLLGEDALEEMHSAELFVLAASLYGHDWGMAMGKDEKQYILTGALPNGVNPGDLCVLPDEFARVRRFAREHALTVAGDGYVHSMSLEIWQEYVRRTHAQRSSTRMRRFFETIDGGVADAASRVCESHWLTSEELQDAELYPVNYSLLRESVNLRALAVYLRLVDLFDFAEDRTPYAIWKFVAPRDPRSKMEWDKHRALRPITCPPYQDGRIVQVDGSTDNHEVYAALEDLRRYCQEQLKESRDVLARMNDARHRLNLYHVQWRVAARGFKKVSVKFEFHRDRMFEILSDEIYQGDPYVFLRELVQNGVDAIRMRREILSRGGHPLADFGEISVSVDHGDNGNAIVTCQDNGIGMDEYMVRNYLAVAGKSYYRSWEFERQGLMTDPISRFGIGILSCFMVADRIEIKTYKDPYLRPAGEPLRIVIPAVDRQFRVEICPSDSPEVGTTVRVFVDGKKLATRCRGRTTERLHVADYLSAIAGFVEFPIVVTEEGRVTLLIHPRADLDKARASFGEVSQIRQINLAYPWEQAYDRTEISLARALFKEVRIDIRSDLGLDGHEGSVTYLMPKEETVDFWTGKRGEKNIVVRRGLPGHPERAPKVRSYGMRLNPANWNLAPSSKQSGPHAVYRNGILLPEAKGPSIRQRTAWKLADLVPPICVRVNLTKSHTPGTNLARTSFSDQEERWDTSLVRAYERRICAQSLEPLLELDPPERLYQMGRLVAMHGLCVETLWGVFPHERWPVAFLHPGGEVSVREWGELMGGNVPTLPSCSHSGRLEEEAPKLVASKWLGGRRYFGLLTKWEGEPCVLTSGWRGAMSLYWAGEVIDMALEKTHIPSQARFLEAPWLAHLPLIQVVFRPAELSRKPPSVDAALETISQDPTVLSQMDPSVLSEEAPDGVIEWDDVIEFNPPFERYFAYGSEMFNSRHPLTQILMRIDARRLLAEIRDPAFSHELLEELDDRQERIPDLEDAKGTPWEKWLAAVHRYLSVAAKAGLVTKAEVQMVSITRKDFIPGTLVSRRGKVSTDRSVRWPRGSHMRGFGLPVTGD